MAKEHLEGNELNEHLRHIHESTCGWRGLMTLTTTGIVALTAAASVIGNNYCDTSSFRKTDAAISASDAASQWSYFQAKSLKLHIADLKGDELQARRYQYEMLPIKAKAEAFDRDTKRLNEEADILYERHHRIATGIAILQTAIAASALSAVMAKKRFWILSLIMTAVGVGVMVW